MSNQAQGASDAARPHLQIAQSGPSGQTAHVQPRPEASVPSEVDPLFAVSIRAFLLDAGILGTSVAIYIWAMIRANYLYDRPVTPLTGAALVIWWLLLLVVRGAYEARHLGVGSEEFKRVVTASMTLLAVISLFAYILPVAPPLRLVLPSLLIGTMLILLGRWLLRTWLGRQRLEGRFQQSTLLVGDRQRTAELAAAFDRDPQAGFQVIGTVPPPRALGRGEVLDAWLDDVMAWIHGHNVHAVAVAESRALEHEVLRRLAWRLEGPRIDLLVSPQMSDVAGPRVSIRPAAGLPLLHLDEPSLTGPKRALKRALDLAVAVPALILLSPFFLAIVVAIKLDSLGSPFYVSTRIGRGGQTFPCLKFRTMISGADSMRADVIGEPDAEISDRYREDPRVTRVGRILRRWSLDELPQLLNVVTGAMSLVGPRPMLPTEVGLLGDADHRRHLTKPGLTGLWQISGRKEVSWDDRMRMDLHYIETWSLALDLVILIKTTKAVITGHGAF